MVVTRSMVALMREAKGWTQSRLAQEADMSQAVVSRAESGALVLDHARLERLADVLDCPAELLERDPQLLPIETTCMHRRRASTMTVGVMKRIEAITHLSRITVEGLLDGVELASSRSLKRVPVTEQLGPTQIAAELRQRWAIPAGPIENLIGLVESAGVVVVVRPFGTSGQDAVSTWPHHSDRPPIMVVNADLPTDRLRFTVAHELGHLVMHALPSDDQEREANGFAGEFLAPSKEIGPQLDDLRTGDFRRLATLKTTWGLSMAALIRRAHDLGKITDRQYREFQVRLAKLGWRTLEPVELAPEKPSVVDRVIAMRRQVQGSTDEDLAEMAAMTPAAFARHYLPQASQARPILRLEFGD